MSITKGMIINSVLGPAMDAWNRQDIDGMALMYALHATFVSGNEYIVGKGNITSRMKARYSDPASMGFLNLELVTLWTLRHPNEERTMLAVAIVRWELTAKRKEKESGHSTLIIEEFSGRYLVTFETAT